MEGAVGVYDHIIVGAGSAGCVLAARLSTDPGARVCLLEAGPPDRHPLIHIPLGIALLGRNRRINWACLTAPEAGLGGRRLFQPRGRTLGGSSSINAMIYMRGHPDDYAGWAAAAGTELWGWDRALTLFRRMERNLRHGDDAHHGADGALWVDDLGAPNRLSHAFVEAGVEAGLPRNADFNGAVQEGVGLYQVTQREGRRWSAARAFLEPALTRPNLTVLTGARALRVILEGRRAVGVALRGRELRLRLGGEVILAAGAIASPQMLMLSGIGPGTALQGMGIAVAHDLPAVGRDLQDHLDVTVMCAANSRIPVGLAPSFLPRALRAARAHIRREAGEFSSNAAEAGGFARSDPSRDRPNLQFHFVPGYQRDHGRQISFGYGFTLHVCDLLPKSRGRITLSAPDPEIDPVIAPNYLDHPDDVQTLLAGLKLARRLMAAPALAAHARAEVHPGPQVQSDADLIADIRARAETIYHPVGTCRMGADAASVVDPALRVRGIDGLRVVDASVMPRLVAGNTNAPAMMIAENAADMILGLV